MLDKLSIDTINSMSISELDVLKFIDGNKKLVLQLSIQNLACKMFVSTATIMRVCKKLGFSGFSELKYYLKKELSEQANINESMTFLKVVENHVKTITQTAALLNEELVDNTVKAMIKAKRVHFFGKGLTNAVLSYASKLMFTKGHSNYYYEDTHIAYISAELMNEDDIVIVSSLSGRTHQIVRMAQIAKSRKALVVTITANSNNELAKLGDFNFGIYSNETTSHPADISSRLPILFLLNIIINMYVDESMKRE